MQELYRRCIEIEEELYDLSNTDGDKTISFQKHIVISRINILNEELKHVLAEVRKMTLKKQDLSEGGDKPC